MKLLSSDKPLLPPNVGVLLFPTILLVVLVVLYMNLFKTGYSGIVYRLKELKDGQKNQAVLEQKVELLQEVEVEIIDQIDFVTIALPEKNPGLWFLSSLKRLAEDKTLSLADIKISGETEDRSGALKAGIAFDVLGTDEKQILGFLKEIRTLAPLSIIKKVHLAQQGGSGSIVASVELETYWADFPEKLPALTEPIKDFTVQERDVLSKLSELKAPELMGLTPSVPESERVDPFSF